VGNTFNPIDPDYEARITRTFNKQGIMRTLGITLEHVEPGKVDLALPIRDELSQQHGYLHAGVVTTLLDTAGGLAALTLMPINAAVLAIEFKANFLAPAQGELLIVHGQVIRAGRTITVCSAEAYAVAQGRETHVSTMTSTVMTLIDRDIHD
jgi:uncharacterized protein (TIGR00369 family)